MAEAALIAGTAISAYSAYGSGQAKADQAKRNAAMAAAAAADSLRRGEQRAWQVQETSARRQGAQELGYAHAGVDVASGSPASVIAKTAMVGELEAQIQRNNAYREAFGYQTQAANWGRAASAAETQSYLDAAGIVLGGTGRALGAWPGAGPGGFSGSDFSPGGSHEGWT